MPEQTIGEAGAVYAFMGWLLTQEEAGLISIQRARDLVKQFCTLQGWPDPPEDWHQHIKPCKMIIYER